MLGRLPGVGLLDKLVRATERDADARMKALAQGSYRQWETDWRCDGAFTVKFPNAYEHHLQ